MTNARKAIPKTRLIALLMSVMEIACIFRNKFVGVSNAIKQVLLAGLKFATADDRNSETLFWSQRGIAGNKRKLKFRFVKQKIPESKFPIFVA